MPRILGSTANEYVERLKAEIAGRGDREPQVSAGAATGSACGSQGWWILGGLLAFALLYAGVLPDRVRHPV